MALHLPVPRPHDAGATWKRLLEQADVQNYKRGQDIAVSPGRLIITDTNGATWAVVVSTSGVLSTTAVTISRGTSG